MVDLNATSGIQLCIEKVIGNSARSSRHISVQDDLIAYTASGGVVVGRIDRQTGQLTTQGFYCANSNQKNTTSSANAYLNLYGAGESHEDLEIIKDSYGFPINGEPLIVTGNSVSGVTDPEDLFSSELELPSPSKFKDRVRNINCIAISPNKRYLAIGEAGFQPRILVFSLAPDSSKKPIALIYEHTFGINNLTFSPDSKYLCSLGFVNDGFINIWRIQHPLSIHLHSSNKCSSPINSMIWHEDYVITLGLRFIKVWKPDLIEPETPIAKPLALKGKNVLLGDSINLNFVDASILNNDELLIISATNNLLLLKLNYETLKLIKLEPPKYEFTSISVDYETETIWFGLLNGSVKSEVMSNLRLMKENTPTQSPRATSPRKNPFFPNSPFRDSIRESPNYFNSPLSNSQSSSSPVISIHNVDKDYIVVLNSDETILWQPKTEGIPVILSSPLMKDIVGIKQIEAENTLIFSSSGLIKKLGEDRPLAQLNFSGDVFSPNSLTAVEYRSGLLFAGDKLGALYISQLTDNYKVQTPIYQTKAHSSSINEIIYFELDKFSIIVSVSRDRMIQFFFSETGLNNWDILQTIPIHNGNLLKVQYSSGRVYTCSTDRTISIHKIELVEGELRIVLEKSITCKSTPIEMKVFGDDLIVSTNDRTVSVFKISESFALKRAMKLMNEKISETLLVENFLVSGNIIIASASDKSLRIFNYTSGRPLSVTWGHSESILGLFLNTALELVSIGNDGCLMKWKLQDCNRDNDESQRLPRRFPSEEAVPTYAKVTRKIIAVPTQKLTAKNVEKTTAKTGDNEENDDASPSLSPRLSAATLKRMESKKSQTINLGRTSVSPTRQRSLSPTKPDLSPTKSGFSSKPELTRPISPIRSLSKKGSMDFSNIKSPKPHVVLDGNVSPVKEKPLETNSVDRVINLLSAIETSVSKEVTKIADSDKEKIRGKLRDILKLVDGDDYFGPPKEPEIKKSLNEPFDTKELLETYSTELLKVFERKLVLRENKQFGQLFRGGIASATTNGAIFEEENGPE